MAIGCPNRQGWKCSTLARLLCVCVGGGLYILSPVLEGTSVLDHPCVSRCISAEPRSVWLEDEG